MQSFASLTEPSLDFQKRLLAFNRVLATRAAIAQTPKT